MKSDSDKENRYDRPIFGDGRGGKRAPVGRSRAPQAPPTPREQPGGSGPSSASPGYQSGVSGASVGSTGAVPRVQSSAYVAPRPKRRMSLNLKMLLFTVVIFAGFAVAGFLTLRPEEDRYVLDTYQYSTVGRRDFRNVIHSAGRVVPTATTVINAPAEARVEEVYFAAGDDVVAGQLLAVLVSEQLEADIQAAQREYEIAQIEVDQSRLQHEHEVTNARGELEKAEANLKEAEAKLPVMEGLYELGGISLRELEEARAAVQTAIAARDRARDNLDLAQRKVELAVKRAQQQEATARAKLADLAARSANLEVVAPIGARLLESPIKVGDRVRQGDLLFRLADVSAQHVETTVTTEQAASIAVGAPALIRTSDAQYPAVVSQVSPLAVADSGGTQVPVRLSVAKEVAARFLPNAPVTVEIEMGELKGRPYLRRGPFFTSGNASFVYVLNADRTQAERRDVRYGAIDGDFVEITAGLEPGDQIIYSSYTAFRSYRTVDLMPEGGRIVE